MKTIYKDVDIPFRLNKKIYKYLESIDISCFQCAFEDDISCCKLMQCSAADRIDNKNTIVKEIKTND